MELNDLQWNGVKCLTKLMFTADPVKKVPTVLNMLFPAKWLSEKAESDPHAEHNGNTKGNEQGKTNYDIQKEVRISFTPTSRRSLNPVFSPRVSYSASQ